MNSSTSPPANFDWAEGYRQQALADMNGARLVQGSEPSVLAMLLQMVLEKLGKAALLRNGQLTVARAHSTHQAATTMMQLIQGQRRKAQKMGYHQDLIRYTLTPLVQQLESLNPSVASRYGAKGPWLEYPWADSEGKVCWPARDLPTLDAFRPKRPKGGLLLFEMTERLCERFDEIFG